MLIVYWIKMRSRALKVFSDREKISMRLFFREHNWAKSHKSSTSQKLEGVFVSSP